MIPNEIIAAATAYARTAEGTYPGTRRFLEAMLENAERASTASRRGVALDAVPRTSYFMDPECITAADAIWEDIQPPSPSSFFEGKTWSQGMDAYQAFLKTNSGRPKGKGAYV